MYIEDQNKSKIELSKVFNEKVLERNEIISQLQQSVNFVRSVQIHIRGNR